MDFKIGFANLMLFLEIKVSISVAPAPDAFIFDFLVLSLKVYSEPKLTQELDAPVSKINLPFTLLILALISKWLVLVSLSLIFL